MPGCRKSIEKAALGNVADDETLDKTHFTPCVINRPGWDRVVGQRYTVFNTVTLVWSRPDPEFGENL
jgi:hypothetical protein